jgi:hypothetical protein
MHDFLFPGYSSPTLVGISSPPWKAVGVRIRGESGLPLFPILPYEARCTLL